ncbi:3-hydroxyisobutyrate dehydrogenase [Reticulomyxa filosa]|uniref:3-hydroxyisobutyrate dehydrogenase n=1 Tax=Reticulomyxa filosa TaxID=46433 RepID=X6N3H5_RETFI|nr:3-hydroxyisobutyrate dehydrogenase [Reticulomyxa filosa]|eukprot:ETO19852.1 3-hydroxyisobutyrate dehydrogenase [Reticulomyxa filosa]
MRSLKLHYPRFSLGKRFSVGQSNFSSTSSDRKPIGLVGLGKIGSAMGRNFVHRGQYSVVGYDIDRGQRSRFYDSNAHTKRCEVVSHPSELMERCDTIVTVLPNDTILKSFVSNEMLPHFRNSSNMNSEVIKVHISCSTVGPQTAHDLYTLQQERTNNRFEYMSAPVFARPDGMAKAQAYIPISGNLKFMPKCSELLQHTSTEVCGFGADVKSACVVKLCGNFLIASAIESMAESFTLGAFFFFPFVPLPFPKKKNSFLYI